MRGAGNFQWRGEAVRKTKNTGASVGCWTTWRRRVCRCLPFLRPPFGTENPRDRLSPMRCMSPTESCFLPAFLGSWWWTISSMRIAEQPTSSLPASKLLTAQFGACLLFLLSRLPLFEGTDILAELIDDESKGLNTLYLGPLGATDVEELLSQLVDDTECSRRLAVRLHREGEGNPYSSRR